MTFHLTPLSRRNFLTATAAGGVATLVCRDSFAVPTSPATWALLADTHIAGDKSTIGGGDTNMFDNLNRVIDQILTEDPLPLGAIINGDCAYLEGFEKDYQTLRRPLARLTDAGIPVHMTMGNHDNRGPFYKTLAAQKPATSLVEGKHVTVVKAGPVNFFLIDSLMQVNVVTGEIGSAQLAWLDRALSASRDQPAIVFGHHNLQAGQTNVSGIKDTKSFVDVLHSHPHVAAYYYGHTHDWKLTKSAQGLNLINQPPVAYLFDKSRPNGWVRMTISAEQTKLELRSLKDDHPQQGEVHELPHRSLASTP